MIDENELLEIAKFHLNKVLEFDPYKSYKGVNNRNQFKNLMMSDPAFASLGLNDDRYVIARVGGNLVTSLHRKIGDMYEALFGYLLQKKYNMTAEELNFSVDVRIGGRTQKRSTDGLIKKEKFTEKIPHLFKSFDGIGFELRSCYQIGDSKRIQADYDMSLALKAKNILPIMLIFCTTSLKSPVARLSKSWTLYEGEDSFEVVKQFSDFDLYAFMISHKKTFETIIDKVFSTF